MITVGVPEHQETIVLFYQSKRKCYENIPGPALAPSMKNSDSRSVLAVLYPSPLNVTFGMSNTVSVVGVTVLGCSEVTMRPTGVC